MGEMFVEGFGVAEDGFGLVDEEKFGGGVFGEVLVRGGDGLDAGSFDVEGGFFALVGEPGGLSVVGVGVDVDGSGVADDDFDGFLGEDEVLDGLALGADDEGSVTGDDGPGELKEGESGANGVDGAPAGDAKGDAFIDGLPGGAEVVGVRLSGGGEEGAVHVGGDEFEHWEV